MAQITLKGNKINTLGNIPAVGSTAPAFKAVKIDLTETGLDDYKGKKKVLNIFPSVDTPTCATSVRKFNQEASSLPNTVVLCLSADLPFALKRFCGAEGLNNVIPASTFRSNFAKEYKLEITEGPLTGLCSRVVLVLDENNKVLHAEQVSEIASEPDYSKVITLLKK